MTSSSALALLAGCWLAALPAAAQETPSQGLEVLNPKKAAKYILKQEVPEYPPLARVNFIQGSVRLLVKVGREGQVSEAHILAGHPFLAVAALKAIRNWVYRPARSRPAPAEFQTFVDMNFALRYRKLEQLPRQPEMDLRRQVRPPELAEKPAESPSAATLRLRLLVGPEGSVVDSQPLAGMAMMLDEARENVSRWKFRPARWGTLAVPWYLEVDVPVQGWPASRAAADPGGQ
jgi:TonB family protein